MRILFCWVLVSLLFSPFPSSSEEVITVSKRNTGDDASYEYYIDLINKVLSHTEAEFGEAMVVESSLSISQKRAFSELNQGNIDLFWSGTNTQRERDYQAIRVPLFGGLLGMRVPVIRAEQVQEFTQIVMAGQLKALIACQGDHWPDSDILEDNGYRVERVSRFELMYSMLRQGRCDYFPRGLPEVYAEVEQIGASDLVAFDSILLSYRFPMYLFVSKDSDRLAVRLEQGLLELAETGELKAFMERHPVTRMLFPLSRYKGAKIFVLENRSLSASTPLNNQALWLQVPPD
ncbi:transporter substrate-binding domain-containing protein [uncultured Shewanella sp.]|uniref:transporter substrate-binding domain-containing protein n=1 Tax=Shewanella atlantica TaxID=271099 RepID=UPI002619D7C2|nr:transporter substrate-binding domain-containing protein [uncultured Shewanella sp.]